MISSAFHTSVGLLVMERVMKIASIAFFSLLYVATMVSAQPAAYTPPLVGLPDTALHDLYLNGLDLPTAGDSPLLFSLQSGTWTITVQNSGSVSWTDLHMVAIYELGGVDFVPNVTVTGWGTLPPQNFTLSGGFFGLQLADFVAPAGQVVTPGSQVILTVPVINHNATFGVRHHLQLQATIPEPATLGAGGVLVSIGLLRRRRDVGKRAGGTS